MKWIIRSAVALVALVAIAVLTLVAVGHRAEAGHLHLVAEIQLPPAQLWPWLNEGDRLRQWVSWLVEVRPADPGTSGVGSKVTWVMHDRNNANMPMSIEATYEEYAPPALLTVATAVPGSFTGRQSYRLTDLGGGRTRFEVDGWYRFEDWFAALLEPVITPAAQKKLDSDVAHLKSLAESGSLQAVR